MTRRRPVRHGLDVATDGAWSEPARLVELAVEAEVHGWDGFFLWDIALAEDPEQGVADPWTTLGAIAHATSRLRIGVLVTPLVRRAPWDLAKTAANLDRLSEGRLILGVGLGWREDELASLGYPTAPLERAEHLDEGLEVMSRLWTGEPVTFEGRHTRLDDVRMRPMPMQRPRIPIWTAAGWPRKAPLRRAIRWDGVCLMTEHQERHDRLTADDVRAVANEVAAARDPIDFDIAVNHFSLDEADGGVGLATSMVEAGATWLIELTPVTMDEHRALIRRGPVPVGG
jgi:alkanesulfonate monooxygenase SsuD/methylene tetrahydromethanopterin reductase-like flavin-dependent oxidoreductase (luciferase family)